MKMLLVAPIKDSGNRMAQYPPLPLGYLATALRNNGHKADILDCVAEEFTFRDFEKFVVGGCFDIIGFTVFSLALKEVKRSLEIVKEVAPDTVTIVGGAHVSGAPAHAMEFLAKADYGFKGEAEIGLPKLLDSLDGQNFSRFPEIPGLIWRDGKKIFVNQQIHCKDLDELGFPAWDLIKPEKYYRYGSSITKYSTPIISTRGCPYKCSFCSAWITAGRKVRRRSISHIMEEMEYLIRNNKIGTFILPDENFTLSKDFVMEFGHGIKKRGWKLKFVLPNGIRLNTLDDELLIIMREIGFDRNVAVGIESGSDRILKKMKKGLTVKLIKEKVALMNRAGFYPTGYFILGFPGETKEDIDATISLSLELKLAGAGFSPFMPLPGTEIYDELVADSELPTDFDFTHLATDQVTYAPKGMTTDELDYIRRKAILRFNFRPRPFLRYMKDYGSFRFALHKFKSLFLDGVSVFGKRT